MEKFEGFENYGIVGDRIEHVMWRRRNDGMISSPKVAIILVGTNNVSACNTPAQIAKGIADLVVTIGAGTTFVVKLLPRWDQYTCEIPLVNQALSEWSWPETVHLLKHGVAKF